jgi:simple sugar transport system substrate-binding protein
MRRAIFWLLLGVVLFIGCKEKGPAAGTSGQYTIATVVKLDGIAWFDRMKEGVRRFGRETGNRCLQLGPSQADAALQVQIIEDLIAQGVNAICIVPFSVEAVEPVLKKARDHGIVVVCHEASNQVNADAIIEAFDNAAYGAHLMDHLARLMGQQGEYAVFVGSLTSKSHNEWIDAAIAKQRQDYPKMILVTERIEEYDNQNIAYEKTKELIRAYPNLRGIQGSASTTAAGAGLAVEEKSLQARIAVVGTGLPSQCGPYLKGGGTKLISFWDPADAGYVMNKLAVMLLEHKELADGMDLGAEGYHSVHRDTEKPNLFYGSAWVDVTKENAEAYDF